MQFRKIPNSNCLNLVYLGDGPPLIQHYIYTCLIEQFKAIESVQVVDSRRNDLCDYMAVNILHVSDTLNDLNCLQCSLPDVQACLPTFY